MPRPDGCVTDLAGTVVGRMAARVFGHHPCRIRAIGVLVGGVLVAGSCGGASVETIDGVTESSTPSSTLAEQVTETTTVDETTTTTEPGPTTTLPVPEAAVMQLAFQLSTDARWADGTKIGLTDIVCTVDALRSTPGSIGLSAYDAIIEVRAGRAEDLVEVYFDRFVGEYRTLFDRIIQASSVDACSDVGDSYVDVSPLGWNGFQVEAWNAAQMILVPTETGGDENERTFDRLVVVPVQNAEFEIDLLRSGELDLILPDLSVGAIEGLDDPNLGFEMFDGGRHEDMYLRSDGVFANDVFRDAFWSSVDRQRLIDEVYAPISPNASVWNCGPVGRRDWCDGQNAFAGSYNPGAGAQALTEAGWTFDDDGYWQDDTGSSRTIRWLVEGGHARQSELVDVLVPMMRDEGFRIEVENCSGSCVFTERLAGGQWDLAVWSRSSLDDIGLLAARYSCSQYSWADRPGWNSVGFCDAEADALLDRALATRDEAEQVLDIRRVLERIAATRFVLPITRLPSAVAWRPDKLGPSETMTELGRSGSWSLDALSDLQDLDGDRTIVIGVESWPSCTNPVLVCSSTDWYGSGVGGLAVPGIWATADGLTLTHSSLVRQAPFVTELR